MRIENGFIEMALHWQGGDHTALKLKMDTAGKHRWTVSQDMLTLVRLPAASSAGRTSRRNQDRHLMIAKMISRMIARVSIWSSTGNAAARPERHTASRATLHVLPQKQRQYRSFKPDHTIRRPWSQGPCAQTAIACPPHHDQIAIVLLRHKLPNPGQVYRRQT